MENKHDMVQIKVDEVRNPSSLLTKAFQMKIDDNKTLIVYNRVNSYILEALLKAVFDNAH
jgi:hypothetical protein